jgi:hypothetical protein
LTQRTLAIALVIPWVLPRRRAPSLSEGHSASSYQRRQPPHPTRRTPHPR